MSRSVAAVAVLAFALIAGAPSLASAETTAVVVGGDPGKRAAVVDAIAPWLSARGQSVVLDSLPAPEVDKLVDCFVTDDQACGTAIVAGAGVDHLVFVMVQVNAEDDVSLSGWLFDRSGAPSGTAQGTCPGCRVETLTRAGEQLVASLWQQVEPPVVLTVRTAPSGAAVSIDGAAVGTSPVEHPVAPGSHEVVVEHPGYRRETRTIQVTAASTLDVELGRAGGGGGKRRGRLPVILIGAGAALAVGGGVLFALDEDVPPLHPDGPEPKSYFDSGTTGVVLIGVGVAAAGAGLALYLFGGGGDAGDERPAMVVRPTAGGGTIGWQGSF